MDASASACTTGLSRTPIIDAAAIRGSVPCSCCEGRQSKRRKAAGGAPEREESHKEWCGESGQLKQEWVRRVAPSVGKAKWGDGRWRERRRGKGRGRWKCQQR